MLDLIRRKAQSPYIQATILIIVLVFVFWLPRAGRKSGGNTVATVNDEAISYPEFQQAYDRVISRYRDQFGGALPKGLAKTLRIKEQVINQLIEKHLVQQAALKSGLGVSKEEVRNTIQNMEAFRNNGHFDLKRYKEILGASRMSVTDFEGGIRSDIFNRKIADHLGRFAKISETEIRDRFARDNAEVKLKYAVFDPARFKDSVKVTDKKLASFFKERKDNYKTPPQVRLKYLLFPFDDQAAATEVSDQAVEEYYQSHRDKFDLPERRRARHILIKSAETDTRASRDRKRRLIEDLLKRARAGEDFAALARKYSEDGSAVKGGDLGYFSRGQMIKPFEDAVFNLKAGEISGVVTTRFGFHIIKLEAVQPARTIPLAEARAGIRATLRKERARNKAFGKANNAYEGIILSGSMDKYAGKNSIAVLTTGFFTRRHPPKELAADSSFLDTAFRLKKGELSSLVEGSRGYGIIFVDDRKEPEVPPMAEVKDRLRKDFIDARAKEMARKAAEKMLAELKKGAKFEKAARKEKVTVRETGFFSRVTRARAGLPEVVANGGLKLSAGQPYPGTIGTAGSSFYVYRFLAGRMPAPDLYAGKKAELEKQILREKQEQLLAAWVRYLRKGARITTNQQFLQ